MEIAHSTELFRKPGLLLAALWLVCGPGVLHATPDQWVKKPGISTSAAKKIEKKWGIRVLGIRRTATDYLLDFRFRVLDKKKVGELMDRKIRPELLVEGKDIRLSVPVTSKLGSLRQSAKFAKADTNYFMLFANPGKAVKKGDKVTIRIGKFKVEHVVVQ